MSKKILLTGATGFLGSHVLSMLLNRTSDDILILKRSFSDLWRIKELMSNPRVSYIDIDNNNLADIDWQNIDTIIHCATEYGRSSNSCYKVLETNLMFPINLIECAIKNNVKTFINTDSYFNKENMSYSNLLNYSLSKKSLNMWLKYFSKNIKIINMVLEHIYGENDNSDKFVERMIQDIAIDPKPFVDLTYGEQKRDFIYVNDVCETYIAALKYSRENNFRFRQFDIGTGKPVSIKQFVETIKLMATGGGGDLPVLNFGKLQYREDEMMCSYADTVELSALINTDKFLSYQQGIEKIIKYYREGKNVNKR